MKAREHARAAVTPASAAPAGGMAPTGRASAATASGAARIPGIDALRGIAIVAMVAYHFAFDLAHAGVTAWNFYHDPFWLHARTVILSSFLLLAGVSVVLADRAGAPPQRAWLHVGRIAGCALLVTAATLVVFPRSFIWFGVLHAIAVSLVLARPFARRPWLALAAGTAMIVAGNLYTAPVFDTRALGWIGFSTQRPFTEDYVPLFPWTGVVLVGIGVGHALADTGFRALRSLAGAPRLLRVLGRHSLAVYMIHQPILMGIAWVVAMTAVGRHG